MAAGGLVLLAGGAESLVRGASRLAILLGVSPLVVGLTIVAFGTSAPELVVSVQSAWEDQVDVATGNVIGSNIVNICLILGLSAVVCPIPCNPSFVKREVPLMIAVTLLAPALGVAGWWTGHPATDQAPMTLPRWSCIVLLGSLAAYTLLRYFRSGESPGVLEEVEEIVGKPPAPSAREYAVEVGLVAMGLVGLVFGARFFLDGALDLAGRLNIHPLVISLTLVALGTSLPELATSIVAAVRNHSDISVGNVVGSNVFNILAVLGGASAVRSLPMQPDVVFRDYPIALGLSLLCLPIMITGRRVSRLEGAGLIAAYAAYAGLLAFMSR
jgi:cation:H+ antiporter